MNDALFRTQMDERGWAHLPSLTLRPERLAKLNQLLDAMQGLPVLQPQLDEVKVGPSVFDEDGTGLLKQIQYLDLYHADFARLKNDVKLELDRLLFPGIETDTVNCQMLQKHGSISKPTRSHQDNAYFKISPAIGYTAWIALDDIDERNGCLSYASGSHKQPTHLHGRYHKMSTFRVRSGVPGLSLCLHEHREDLDTPVPVTAGTVLVHHINTIHRAGLNSTGRRRRAICIPIIAVGSRPDPVLVAHSQRLLAEDVELQRIKNPALYRSLKA
jgi:hypothetical protein